MPSDIDANESVIVRLDAIDSTNSEALRQARAGTLKNAWVLAETQTGGRGRTGRGWSSAPGGLYASRLMISDLPLQNLTGLTFTAGIAVYDTSAEHLSPDNQAGLMLKWPNDLLHGPAKLSGILTETEPLPGNKTAVAIGIGLNVANTIDNTDAPTTSLARLGGDSDVTAVFASLAKYLAKHLVRWDEGAGFMKTLEDWQARAMTIGTATQVRLPHETIRGTYAGVDHSGALALRLQTGGTRIIHAGEIIIAPNPGANGAQS